MPNTIGVKIAFHTETDEDWPGSVYNLRPNQR